MVETIGNENNIVNNIVIELATENWNRLLDSQNVIDETQLMYPAYAAAWKALQGIIAASDKWNHSRSGICSNNDTSTGALYGYPNNIIAFCAPRGQGKTSAMLSFSRAIERSINRECDEYSVISMPNKENRGFCVLSPIDPTMLESGDSAILLVLSRLFHMIEQKWEHPDSWGGRATDRCASRSNEENKKIEILEKVQRCYSWFVRSGGKTGTDDLKDLLRFSDIFDIKQNLHEIIKYYFELCGYSEKNSFLVIQLDDTDMEFECAYDVLESVRKYLALPNTVVLMATHLEQLRVLIEQHYRTALKDMKELGGDVDPHRMAAKYLDKLIPVSHTVYLPTMRLERDMHAQLRLKDPTNVGIDKNKLPDLEITLFELIAKKTGLVFVKHGDYLHNLIPSTLRGFQQLFRLLDEMEPYGIPEWREDDTYPVEYRANMDIRQRNLRLFEDYFINDWCSSKLRTDDWQIIQEIDKTASMQRIRFAIDALKKHQLLSPKTDKQKIEKIRINGIHSVVRGCHSRNMHIDPITIECNPHDKNDSRENTYIELLNTLKTMEEKCNSESDYYFVFAVHTYFSIMLNKLAIIDEKNSVYQPLRIPQYDCLYQFLTGVDVEKARFKDKTLVGNSWFDENTKLWCERIDNNDIRDAKSTQIIEKVIKTLSLKFNNETEDALNRGNRRKSVIGIINLIAYICCNWDVQDQIMKFAFSLAEDKPLGETALDSVIRKITEDKGDKHSPQYLFMYNSYSGIDTNGAHSFVMQKMEAASVLFAFREKIPGDSTEKHNSDDTNVEPINETDV